MFAKLRPGCANTCNDQPAGEYCKSNCHNRFGSGVNVTSYNDTLVGDPVILDVVTITVVFGDEYDELITVVAVVISSSNITVILAGNAAVTSVATTNWLTVFDTKVNGE